MILLFAFADPECLYDDYTNNPKMEGIRATLVKHLKERGADAVPELVDYTMKRLSEYNPTNWLKVCGIYLWMEIVFRYPDRILNGSPDDDYSDLIDSARVIFEDMIRQNIAKGSSPEESAMNIFTASSFLRVLMDMGVNEFRREYTCGYW